MARVGTGPIPKKSPFADRVEAIQPRERRRGARQPLEMVGVVAEPVAPDKTLDVAVLNVSLHGCAFRAPVEFRKGALYTMKIGTGALHLTSTVRIVSSRERDDRTWDIGAKFV